MSEPFIGEIRIVGFGFAPNGWALCDGQLMAISQNQALFSLLGTTYGGDGQSTFALPDLQGRIPMHQGSGAGLSTRVLGESAGAEAITLTAAQMPQHNHPLNGTAAASTSSAPANHVLAGGGAYANPPANYHLDTSSIGHAGGNKRHGNVQPFLVVNFIIALQGIFPSRN